MSDLSDPRSAPKNTLTGLRQRLDFSVPQPEALERSAFEQLDNLEQMDYDDARLRWFGSGLWIRTPQTIDLIRSVRSQVRTYDPRMVGESGTVITGPAHIGKTTALFRVARVIEQRVAKVNPDYRADGIVPVAYIEVPPHATPKAVAAQIVDFFGTPVNRRPAPKTNWCRWPSRCSSSTVPRYSSSTNSR